MEEKKGLDKLRKAKELVSQNKQRTIVILIAIIAIIAVVAIAVFQMQNSQQSMIDSELQKARTYTQVQENDENVENTDNVKFDAFFLRDLNGDGTAEGLRGTSKQIGKEDTLYMELKVLAEGYLQDAKITINGKNFYLQTAMPKDNGLKDNYIGNDVKEIAFNQMNNGTERMITGAVRSGDYSYSSRKFSAIGNDINNYSQVNSVTLTGTYVKDDGTSINIEKTVEFNIDWYGTTQASILSTSQVKDIESAIDEQAGKVNLDFEIRTQETKRELILKSNHIEAQIPELNGYSPIEVLYTGNDAEWNYDEETKILTIDKKAEINEEGKITKGLNVENYYKVRIVYPIEAYQTSGIDTVQINVPVSTYYEGYNNASGEFTNPYKSNIANTGLIVRYQVLERNVTKFDIKVGKKAYYPTIRYFVSKQQPLKVYNGKDDNKMKDTYQVTWEAHLGDYNRYRGIVMKETKDGQDQVTDQFVKTNSQSESMEDVTTNIAIGFSGADLVLGEDGWIKVYNDETGELIETFTKDNWNNYTSTRTYKYETPVKHIRVETSAIEKNRTSLYVYNIKELNNDKITEKYTKEQFDELQYIQSTLVGYRGEEFFGTATEKANYESPISIAEISTSKDNLSTQVTEKNVKLTINTKATESYNQVKWKNGTFLVKLPEEVLEIEINNIKTSNSSVKIENNEVIQKDGRKFIKIITTNETPQIYSIDIDVNMSLDPRKATTTKPIELYATNENDSDYYYKAQDIYDVNNNSNTTENVNYTTTSISMVAPSSLLTNQIATKYDEQNNMIVSPQVADVTPKYAVVDQDGEEQIAEIGVQLMNNHSNTVSDIQILGKIPFKGNTYVISGGKLGSTFTTKMTSTGISVPEELKEIAKVYYSESENPSKDATDVTSDWKLAEEITDWDNVKTFLIDLGDYRMSVGKELIFRYQIKIPNGLNYNEVSYSHYGVYFSVNTGNGKYKTNTEPTKLGFRIAEKYDLEVQKYGEHARSDDAVVAGATYSLREVLKNEDGTETIGESKTAVTDAEGKLKITNLYAERTYELKEIKAPEEYELSENTIRFIASVDEKGNMTVESIQGEIRAPGNITVSKNEGEKYKARIEVEDTFKINLKVITKEKGTENNLTNVRYKITGPNLPAEGKIMVADSEGICNLKGLSPSAEEYTLQEIKADGYYLDKIRFQVYNRGGVYEANVIEGTYSGSFTAYDGFPPTYNIVLENEKIPTYNLDITKIKRIVNTTMSKDELIMNADNSVVSEELSYLAGAKFKLYKDDIEIGEYTTDNNGKLSIQGLYQYEESKRINQTYTLKEISAPEGYVKVEDIIFNVQKVNGQLELKTEGEKEYNYKAVDGTIKLVLEDNPTFKLVKKDAENQTLIPNVKFVIYNADTNEFAKNSKGETLGVKEVIDGREYYTVTTNSQGEITADLTEGLYKAIELQGPEQYDISSDPYYFGIGTSKEGDKKVILEGQNVISCGGVAKLETVISTSDGGYIVGGYSSFDIILDNGEPIPGIQAGVLIKYNNKKEVEWTRSLQDQAVEVNSNPVKIFSMVETADQGFIVVGQFGSRLELGNGVEIEASNSKDGMLIKYDKDGTAQWAKAIHCGYWDNNSIDINSVIETKDGDYVVAGCFSGSINLGNNIELTAKGYKDGILIKYDINGELQWSKSMGRQYNYNGITSVCETKDGDYVIVGDFTDGLDLGNNVILNKGYQERAIVKYSSDGTAKLVNTIQLGDDGAIYSVAGTEDGGFILGGRADAACVGGQDSYADDGMIIKYDNNGNIQWLRTISNLQKDKKINYVAESKEGGYIAVGAIQGEVSLSDEITVNSTGDKNAIIIKYGDNGDIQWVQTAQGNLEEIAEIKNGGYIAVGGINQDGLILKYKTAYVPTANIEQAKSIGESSSDEITAVTKTNDGGYITGQSFVISSNNEDGKITKYDNIGNVQWTKEISGTASDQIASVAQTTDGGYIVTGTFNSREISLGNGVTLIGDATRNVMIIKYSSNGETEWAKAILGEGNEYLESMVATKDGGFVLTGTYTSKNIKLGNNISLEGNGTKYGMMIKYNSYGEAEWANSVFIGYDGGYSVAETNNGEYLISGFFYHPSIDFGNGVKLNNCGGDSRDAFVAKYSHTGEAQWAKLVGGDYNDIINELKATKDNGCIVIGQFSSKSIELGNGVTIGSNGSTDGMIIKYDSNGKAEWAKTIVGSGTTYVTAVDETTDGGYIVGGDSSSKNIDLGDNITITNNGGQDGMIIKYNSNGEPQWAKAIGGTGTEKITAVTEIIDGEYIAGGSFTTSSLNFENGTTINNNGSTDGILIKIRETRGAVETEELVVKNSLKEFKIATEVKELNGVKGGTISGEEQEAYETVKYGQTSTKEILMTPNENYEIIKITVNDEDYKFTANADGTYRITPFENITENKNVVVTYALKSNKITINKVDNKTKAPLQGAKFKLEKIDGSDSYSTEVTTNSEGKAITQLPFGTYKLTEIKAPEGYELNEEPQEIQFTQSGTHEFTVENKAKGKVIVHHYRNGGTYKVAEDEVLEGKVGERYTTSPHLDLEQYELVKNSDGSYKLPENATGVYEEGTIEVIYYYSSNQPEILKNELIKESVTKVVTDKTQKIPYDITYEVVIKNFFGGASITITDQLPYEIDVSKSSLDGGTYDETNKTIIWEDHTGSIKTTSKDDELTVRMAKHIELVYKDINTTEPSIINTVEGLIDFDGAYRMQVDEDDTNEIPTNFLKDVKVSKVWEDNNNENGKRPSSIKLLLKNGSTIVNEQVVDVTNDNTLEYTFTNVPKYDTEGNEIVYTVDEEAVNENDLKFYSKSIEGLNMTNRFIMPNEIINITVNKVWNDNEIQAQRRPNSIIVVVKDGDKVVAEQEITKDNIVEGTSNQWAGIIENLPRYNDQGNEIKYTIEEKAKNADDLKFYTSEVTEVTDDQATIRSTFTKPEDKTSITLTKTWVDNNNEFGKRPAILRFQLKEENEVKEHIDTVVADNMEWVFGDLPKYNDNGQEIQYTVDEAEINPGDLQFYTKTIDGTHITNTFTVPDEKINVTVTKVWEDNEIQAQRRPGSVVLILKHNDTEVARKEISAEDVVEGTTNQWRTVFENVQKYDSMGNIIEYTVEEAEKNSGDLHFYKGEVGKMSNVIVDGEATDNKKITIKNTFTKSEDKTSITVTKTWVDNNNEAGKRPAILRFQVKEGNEVKEYVDTAVSDDMRGVFENLPKYNDNGQEIQYTVDEAEINPGDLQFYTKTIDGTHITNTFTHNTDTTNVKVTKKWVDNDVQKEKRPDSITIQLKNGNQVIQTKELPITKTENEFTVTFEDLPKYDDHNNIINYTADEVEDLQFYTKSISGTVITNTFIKPEDTVSIEVNKQWEDQNDIFGKRPDGIIIRVKIGEEVARTTIVSKQDDWKCKFEGLAKYNSDGQEIVYTVDELDAVEGGLFYYEEPHTVEVIDSEGTNKKQATITNRMEKVPGFVVVKYIDINTNEEITDSTRNEGVIGQEFDITKDKKEIPGYTLTQEPEQKTGEYTQATQEKVYYYAKNTKVIVKHIEKETNEVLADEVTIEGYEGQDYSTEAKAISNYVVTDTTKNTEGKMARDVIEVIYYYSPKTSVVVKYVEQSTNEVLSTEKTIPGYVGKDYTTEQLQIPNYTLITTTGNTAGKMTGDVIEVIYYYAKNTKVTVKYLEKDDTPNDNTDNTILLDEVTINGYEGYKYETSKQDIPNYKFVEVVGNTTGEMQREQTEVIYYYAQATKATVQYIDRESGEVLKEQSQEGKVGDLFRTQAEDFEGYVLVESPEKPNVTMTKEEQIVKYYYAKISEGLVEKHIDDITGEVLYTEKHSGNEGDKYNIEAKKLEGYDLVEEKLPTNSEGKITTKLIEVKYYYIRKASVKVQYIEKATGKKLTDDVIQEGHQDDVYTSETKEFKGYALIGVPENANGNMSVTKNENGTYNTETVVTYYYVKQSAGVEEKHIDVKTNKVLASEVHKGNVGDDYNIPQREFKGYKLVETQLPSNAKGKMTEEKIVVTYYYIKETKVRVEYIDKLTDEKIATEEIVGFEGTPYETEEKKFDGYDLVEVPSNGKGEMKDKEIVVKYYYQRKAEMEVQYLEKGTNYQIIKAETKSGYVGDDYETEQKEIPYYKFVESTENTKGKMTKEKITVVYYYEKLKFNMGIDKWISNISMNGISLEAKDFSTKDELYKLEINRSKVNTADIRATYKIRISNTGEIEGTVGRITELIPRGFTFYQEDNKIHWEQANGLLSTDTLKSETIKPGEYKEIEIVLRWNKGGDNFGSKVNTVLMSNLNNSAGFEDINKDDNRSTSEMLFSIVTGLDRNDVIILIAVVQIVLAITIGLLLSYKKKEN